MFMWALGFRVNKCSSHTREAAEKYKACTTQGALLEQLSRELRHIQSYQWQNESPETRGTGPKLWGCSHGVLCTSTARSFVTHVCKMYNVPLVSETESFSKHCVSSYCPWSGASQQAPYML